MTKIAIGAYLQSLANSNGGGNLGLDSSKCYTYSKIKALSGFNISTTLNNNQLVKESLISFQNQNIETYNLLMPAIYTYLDYNLAVDYEIEEYDTIYSTYSSLADRLLYKVLDNDDNAISNLSGIEIGGVNIGDPDNNTVFTTNGDLISFWWGKLPNMQQYYDSLLNETITGGENEDYSFYVYGPTVNTTTTSTSDEIVKNAILNAYEILDNSEKNLKFVSWENTAPSNMIFNAYLALGSIGSSQGAEDYVCFTPIRIYAQRSAAVNGSYPITAYFDFDYSQTIETNLTENEYLSDESNIRICYTLPMGVMNISDWNSN